MSKTSAQLAVPAEADASDRSEGATWLRFRQALEQYVQNGAGEGGTLEGFLEKEIGDLLSFIQQAKSDIAAIEPNRIRSHHIPGAHNELDAVVEATEEATGKILDAAESIENLANDSDGELADKLNDIATQIYEASNFQDLTGQRITKVVNILSHIEGKIGELAAVFGHEEEQEAEGDVTVRVDVDNIALHGPKRAEETNAQDDIDRLMAEMEAGNAEVNGQDDIDKLFD